MLESPPRTADPFYSVPVSLSDSSKVNARGRAAAWLIPVLLFFGVFSVYTATAGHEETHIDAHAAMVEAWHIAATGSPWLEGDLSTAMLTNKYIGQAENGHLVGLRMAGPVLAGIPAYWLLNRDADPGQFSYSPGALTAALLAAAAVTLLFLSLRSRLTQAASAMAAMAFAFTTPTWTVSADTLWTHPITQLGIAGAAFGASRGRWWLAGLFLAIGMLGRPHVAVIAAVLGLGAALTARSLRPVVGVGVPTVLSLGALVVWNRWMFGVLSIGGAYGDRAEAALAGFEGSSEWDGALPQLTNYLGFLVSFDRGLLIWSPVVLILLPALVRGWRQLPAWSRWLLIGGLLYSVAQLRINYFPGGDGFWAYRHALELVTCMLPALAFSTPHLGRVGRLLLAPVLAGQFAVMSVGAVATGYSVLIGNVWTDNGFWMALRAQPALLGSWLVLWLVLGAVAAVAFERRTTSGDVMVSGYGRQSPTT